MSRHEVKKLVYEILDYGFRPTMFYRFDKFGKHFHCRAWVKGNLKIMFPLINDSPLPALVRPYPNGEYYGFFINDNVIFETDSYEIPPQNVIDEFMKV